MQKSDSDPDRNNSPSASQLPQQSSTGLEPYSPISCCLKFPRDSRRWISYYSQICNFSRKSHFFFIYWFEFSCKSNTTGMGYCCCTSAPSSFHHLVTNFPPRFKSLKIPPQVHVLLFVFGYLFFLLLTKYYAIQNISFLIYNYLSF